jgi:hypothetical protein
VRNKNDSVTIQELAYIVLWDEGGFTELGGDAFGGESS